jgi:hypothetical protein
MDEDKLSGEIAKSDLEILLRPIGLIITVKSYKLYLRALS